MTASKTIEPHEYQAVTEDAYISMHADRVFVPLRLLTDTSIGEVLINGELHLNSEVGGLTKMSHKLLTQLFLEARFLKIKARNELADAVSEVEDEKEDEQVCQCPDCTAARLEESKAATRH